MIHRLIILGLVIIPSAEILMSILIPSGVRVQFADMRLTKEFWGLAIALASGLWVLYKYGFKPSKSPWVLCFVFYCLFSAFKAIRIQMGIPGGDLGQYINYRPAFKVLVYFLMFNAITSISWAKKHRDMAYNAILGVGLASAGYVLIQYFGLDSIFTVRQPDTKGIITPESTALASFIGQPTLAGSFISMCAPMSFLRNNWLAFAVMSLAVLLTHSAFACGALIISSCFYFTVSSFCSKKILFIFAIVCMSCVIAYITLYGIPSFMNDNGRFSTWENMLKDVYKSKAMLFGIGFGAFELLFPVLHESLFHQAHNEYLQVFYGLGAVGLSLMILSAVEAIRRVIGRKNDDEVYAVMACLFAVGLSALGTFVWQLGAFQYISVFLFGILTQITTKERFNA